MREVLDMVETPTNRWPEPTMVADDDAAPQGAGRCRGPSRRCSGIMVVDHPLSAILGHSLSTGRDGSGDWFKLLELGWSNEA